MSAYVNFVDHLSLDLKEEFIADVVDCMKAESDLLFPDGSIGIRTIKIEVFAKLPEGTSTSVL